MPYRYPTIAMSRHAHIVYFTLNDQSHSAIEAFTAQCLEHLDGHDGLIFFAVGVRDRELNRPVNGQFDVSLHMVFDSRKAHDDYQVSKRHQVFIDQNKDLWKDCRVFDSTLDAGRS